MKIYIYILILTLKITLINSDNSRCGDTNICSCDELQANAYYGTIESCGSYTSAPSWYFSSGVPVYVIGTCCNNFSNKGKCNVTLDYYANKLGVYISKDYTIYNDDLSATLSFTSSIQRHKFLGVSLDVFRGYQPDMDYYAWQDDTMTIEEKVDWYVKFNVIECDRCQFSNQCLGGSCIAGKCPCDGCPDKCFNNICVECVSDNQCPKYCNNHICVDCISTIQCPPGKFCSSNKCVECTINNDCGSRFCLNNICVDCVNGGNCVTNQCINNVCKLPCDTCPDKCLIDHCVECLSNGQCAHYCQDNRCVNCLTDLHCSGKKCVDGSCVECQINTECSTGVCLNGKCLSCISDTDCSSGHCVNNICKEDEKMQTATLVGIIVGSTTGVASLSFAIYQFCIKKKKKNNSNSRTTKEADNSSSSIQLVSNRNSINDIVTEGR